MVRHGSDIVGDDNPAARRAEFENLWVPHLLGDYVLRQFEIDLWLSSQKTAHNLLIEIGVGENRIFKLAGGPRVPWPGGVSSTELQATRSPSSSLPPRAGPDPSGTPRPSLGSQDRK
jgi:hypothetical protein